MNIKQSNKMAKIVYLDNLPARDGVSILENQSEIEVVRIKSNDIEQSFLELKTANAYQVSAARDEVPKIFQVDDEFLSKTPNLVLVSSGGAGFDTIDVEACSKRGILVVNQTGGNAEAVAEHAVALMLDLLKRVTETDMLLRRGWSGTREDYIGNNLFKKTVGLIGLGNTGGRVAEICNKAFNCNILAYDPYISSARFKDFNAENTKLNELLSKSDIVSVHIPLSKETLNFIDKDFFSKMKNGSLFITTSRGSIHNEDDLETFLKNGHLSGAGLDVWEKEPPSSDHKLLKLENVVATPHMAGVTVESRKQMSEFAAKQLLNIMKGGNPERPVNKDILPLFQSKLSQIIQYK